MSSEKRILIGEIATAHGIKGYVKLRVFVDDETLLEHDDLHTDDTKDASIRLKLKNPLKDAFVAEVIGVSDRNHAELLRGKKIYIGRDQLPEPEDDVYYYEDLKGLRVIGKNGEEIGFVEDLQNFGASDLIDVKPAKGGDNFYIPFHDGTVMDVDLEAGTITVEMPEAV